MTSKKKSGPWVVVETLEYDYEGGTVNQVWVFKTLRGARNFHNRMTSIALKMGRNPSLDYSTYESRGRK